MTESDDRPICPKCGTALPPGTPPVRIDPGTLGPSGTGATQIHHCQNCGYEGPFKAPDSN